MIIFMSGFPQAGKSKFVSILLEQFASEEEKIVDPIVLNPKGLLPDDFDELPDKDQRSWQISSWEICLEQAMHEIDDRENSELIILDTAAAQADIMRPFFTRARKRDHHVVYIFVHSNFEERQSRTDADLSKFQEYYSDSFKVTVPHLKKLADYSIVIRNPNDSEYIKLKDSAKTVVKVFKENSEK
tara:strand:- start:64370 stop:64927 length:558 start_codon:yes stop_codon:yes gene_type:complete